MSATTKRQLMNCQKLVRSKQSERAITSAPRKTKSITYLVPSAGWSFRPASPSTEDSSYFSFCCWSAVWRRLRKTVRDFQQIPKSVFLQVPRSKCLSVQHPPTHRSTKSLLQLRCYWRRCRCRLSTCDRVSW